MKAISMFIMIFICMVNFTAGASTAKLEQKQKTEFVKTFNVEASTVSVDFDCQIASVFTEAESQSDFRVNPFDVIKPFRSEATNDDVGWRGSRLNYSQYLKSNLPGTNRIPINADLLNKYKVKIRCDC